MARLLCAMALLGCIPHATSHVPLPAHWAIHYTPCPDVGEAIVAGCEVNATGDIYIGRGRVDPFILWHEVGHAFDAQRLTPLWRDWFTRLFRVHRPWVAQTDRQVGVDEYFADEYAACALGFRMGARGFWEVGYGYIPSPQRYRRFCRALWRVA